LSVVWSMSFIQVNNENRTRMTRIKITLIFAFFFVIRFYPRYKYPRHPRSNS